MPKMFLIDYNQFKKAINEKRFQILKEQSDNTLKGDKDAYQKNCMFLKGMSFMTEWIHNHKKIKKDKLNG